MMEPTSSETTLMALIVAEPATAYSLRTPLVVDASVIAAAVFDEERREAAEGWMFGRACAHLR
jgi:hypothetical protein